MTEGEELAALYRRDLTRLRQELQAFPDGYLHRTVPGITNSAANLVLHLEGNLREYIGRQMGGQGFTRDRPGEFAESTVSRSDLIRRVEELQRDIPPVLAAYTNWGAVFLEQVFGSPISTRQSLVHLHGHFNYHLGQIDYLRRALTGSGSIEFAQLASE